MTGRPEPLDPGESDDERVNELLREAEEGWYGDAAFFGAMAHEPAVFKRIVATFEEFPVNDGIDLETLELLRLKVADTHECAYCATVRTEAVREDVAPKERAIFGDEIDPEPLTEKEHLAVRLAAALSEDPHRITESFFEELRGAFTEREVIELLLFASLEVGLDRFCIALNLDTTERSRYPSDLEYPLEEPRPQE